MTAEVLKRVAALPEKSLIDLKKMWVDLFQEEPPSRPNRDFYVKRLAYRIQELAWGGLSETTLARLEAMAEDDAITERRAAPPTGDIPVSGTRLVREWKGVEHTCTVLEDGFEYQNRKYKSLSAVARAITGTRWNGLVFFALKPAGKSK
ncbi:DUF2924 domain-containing protein [Magnetofaba australis]|uniref:DUF2924 domain-containing protein n=1 Tax=Magnetofaba australis TaxID=1472297 RepID=UPI000A19BA0A|nr:DUF2924 domain-containing protein [Magnetofaba australis]